MGREPLSAALYQRGLKAKEEWRLSDARRLLSLAARLGRKEARLELARTLEKDGDIPAARRLLDELLATTRDDPSLDARILAADAQNLYASGQWDMALERCNQALDAARQVENSFLEGHLLLTSARILYAQMGDLDQGRLRMERALKIARQFGHEDLEADALSGLGAFYWWHQRQRERPLARILHSGPGDLPTPERPTRHRRHPGLASDSSTWQPATTRNAPANSRPAGRAMKHSATAEPWAVCTLTWGRSSPGSKTTPRLTNITREASRSPNPPATPPPGDALNRYWLTWSYDAASIHAPSNSSTA